MHKYRSLVLLLFSCLVQADGAEKERLIQRIQPIGKISISHQQLAEQQTTSDQPIVKSDKKHPGQATYDQFCVICHKAGLAGAPKFRDEKDWKMRLDKRTIDDLLDSALKGLNAMPPKGTCSQCSDDELKDAIDYMLPRS